MEHKRSVYHKMYEHFNIYLTNYIEGHGQQTLLQIKDIAKQYAIARRNGEYDLTARRWYSSIFISYCWKNNIVVPNGFGSNRYDPDNEFPNDPRIIKLTQKYNERTDRLIEAAMRDIDERHNYNN